MKTELKGTVRTSITLEGMEALLQLPLGVTVRQLYYDFDTDSIFVRLEGEDLPFCFREDGAIINDPWVQPTCVRQPDQSMKLEWDFPKQV